MSEGMDSAPYFKFKPHQGEHLPTAPLKDRVKNIKDREKSRNMSIQLGRRQEGWLSAARRHGRNFLLAAGITLGGAAAADATGVVQVPGVHEAIGTAAEILKNRPEPKDINEYKPSYVLEGEVIIKKGAVLRIEPMYPADASTGGQNRVDFDVLGNVGTNNELHYKNLRIVDGWDGGIPQLQIEIPTADGAHGVFTPYKPGDTDGPVVISKNHTLKDILMKSENGREVYYAKGIPPSEIGIRTSPIAPQP